jgi:hypothetical protein
MTGFRGVKCNELVQDDTGRWCELHRTGGIHADDVSAMFLDQLKEDGYVLTDGGLTRSLSNELACPCRNFSATCTATIFVSHSGWLHITS